MIGRSSPAIVRRDGAGNPYNFVRRTLELAGVPAPSVLHFDRFRFDPGNFRLEDGTRPIRLNRKAFDVLRTLIERPGQLVTKDELLDAVWPDAHVADGVLKVCMAEIRRALGDSTERPRFIETVYGRGYRFVATVAAASSQETPLATAEAAEVLAWPTGNTGPGGGDVLVGRGRELERLDECLARALRGERQLVFVTGEAGAGKTSLVEHFVARTARTHAVAVTGGQCLEQIGSAEAYMPVLEAVGRLVRLPGSARTLLRRYAPTCFAQLPWLVEDDDRERLERELVAAARDRMLREMGEFVEALSAETPLVLVLEDLHWSDPSTVDLLSLLAARREPARLLVIGTYRPVDLILRRHPLREVALRLSVSRRAAEVFLDDLRLEALTDYLGLRFPGHRFPARVAKLLHERTDGNALFLVTVVDHLLARSAIAEREGRWEIADGLREELLAIPESLRLLMEQQLERLSAEDRELLEAASLAGLEFSAAVAAAGAGRDAAHVEHRFDRLVGAGSFLRHARPASPDGAATRVYGFRHTLYRETLAAALSPRRRAEAQHRIGTALEEADGGSAALASALAVHFEEGGDRARAARYRRLAAETAARRYAFAEAETHLERGLALLSGLPASPERDREERVMQSALGPVRMATRGYAASEVERAYTRALELSAAPLEPMSFPELWGVWGLHLTRAELGRALELAERMHAIAEASGERQLRLEAYNTLWITHFFRGELVAALKAVEEGEPLYDPAADRGSELVYGQDAKAAALSYRSMLLWSFGRIDDALELTDRATAHARSLGHPMSLAFSLVNGAWLRLLRREPTECAAQAEGVIAYATAQGVRFWAAHGLLLRGWAAAERGDLERGIADIEDGLASMVEMEAGLGRAAHSAHLAAAKGRVGRFAEARELMERSKALVIATGERYHEPEIHRLDAELVLAEAGGARSASADARARAEHILQAAIECARRQGARTLELRAATTLGRLHGRGAKGRQARARIGDLLASFDQGFDTQDLRDARRAR